jgi:HEAT repeat protein
LAPLSLHDALPICAPAAEAAVARLPGPIRIDRHNPHGPTPPLADHGPICALVARFGLAAVAPLKRRVEDASAEVRFYVALALAELGGEGAIPQVADLLFDRDASVRRAAGDALARLGESAARGTVIESLRGELPGPERERQRTAADALGALGDVASVPRLIELVKHDDNMVQSAARRALVAITKQDYGTSRWRWRGWWDRHRSEARAEWLFEGLGHSEDDIRRSSAEELRRMFTESFSYHWDAPKRDREEARKRWHDWYRQKQ